MDLKEYKGYYSNKKILITGGIGFIGSNLARVLIKLGVDISVVDNVLPESSANLFNIMDIKNQIKIYFCDLRDSYSLPHIIKDTDIIFNLAGYSSHIGSMRNPFFDLEMNCVSHLNLLETCRRYNPRVKIIFTSTRQVYGRPQYLPVDEKHPLNPVDINGIHKLTVERYHILFFKTYKLKSTILRLPNVYGPGMAIKDETLGFIGTFIGKAIKGEKIKIFGSGKQKRDFLYVDDVIDALLRCAFSEKAVGEVYNLGHNNRYSLMEVVEILKTYYEFDYEIVDFPEERKKIDIGDYYGDFSKIYNNLGWSPKIDLKEGLEITINYYYKFKNYYL